MRIVAGEFRGRPICPPEGNDTRPTVDRVREALFSSLYSLRGGFEDAIVLDAFAGSGALGLEAVSRGAKHVVFCDNNRKAQETIKRNIDSLGVGSVTELCAVDVLKRAPVSPQFTFDLVLLDPPYKMPVQDVLSLLVELRERNAIAGGALVTYEHANENADAVRVAAEDAGFDVVAQKKYGKTRITIMREPS